MGRRLVEDQNLVVFLRAVVVQVARVREQQSVQRVVAIAHLLDALVAGRGQAERVGQVFQHGLRRAVVTLSE